MGMGLNAAQLLAQLSVLPPEEAVAYMQARGLLTQTFDWRDLWHEEHARQFTVSRLARLDLLQAIHDGITLSVKGELGRRDFMRGIKDILVTEGWWGEKAVIDPKTGDTVITKFDANRLKLIYDINTRQAYSAGLWQRIERNKATSPYIRYITKRDERVRDSHKAWDNLTLPVDHPFWNTHIPPNGWRCRCRIMSMSQADYDKGLSPTSQQLVKQAPPEEFVEWKNKRTGEVMQVPKGVSPGFDYNPGKAGARAVNLEKIKADKLALATEPIRKAAEKDFADNAGMKISLDFTGQRPGLFDLPPIPVTVLSGKEFGEGIGKAGLAKAADALLRQLQHGNGLPNEDTGWLLRINKDGRKKMGDNADLSIAETQSVAGIESLARRSVVAESHPDIEHHNPFVAAVYRLYAPILIDGKIYRVKLTVKDYTGIAAKKELHALAAVEIENAPLGTFPASADESAVQPGQPTTGREISISDLLSGAILFDGTLFTKDHP